VENGGWRIFDITYSPMQGDDAWKSKNLRGRIQEELDAYAHPRKS
jgi:hypothetical protein